MSRIESYTHDREILWRDYRMPWGRSINHKPISPFSRQAATRTFRLTDFCTTRDWPTHRASN